MNEAQISKQHPIPQNFMDVEFKIVGDFTVRQFTYLCATGFPMYLLYNAPIQSFVKTVLLIVFGFLGFLLVFVPIDDRSMDVWIVNFFRSVYANNRRVWRKTAVIPKTLSMEAIKIVQGEMITLAPTSSRRKLEEYLKGIKEEAPDEYDFNFKKFQFREEITYQPTTSITTKVEQMEEISKPIFQTAPQELKKETKPEILEKPAVQEIVIKIPEVVKTQPQTSEVQTSYQSKELFKKFVAPIKTVPGTIREIIKPKPKIQQVTDIHEELRTSTVDVPGRKFVSFSENEQEIILPIRGEKTIQLSQPQNPTQDSNKDIRTLTKELRTLVREIKNDDGTLQNESPEIQNENYLSGICFDQSNKPLTNLMLSLIDENGKEIQYSRSDLLGKFTFNNTQTGIFQIKVLNPEIYSLNFDIIKINVNKYPYTLIQITGKK